MSTGPDPQDAPEAPEPLLSVVSGNPTDEELAALAAVVAALGAQAPLPPARPAHRDWARRRNLRLAPKPGPGSWRRSFR